MHFSTAVLLSEILMCAQRSIQRLSKDFPDRYVTVFNMRGEVVYHLLGAAVHSQALPSNDVSIAASQEEINVTVAVEKEHKTNELAKENQQLKQANEVLAKENQQLKKANYALTRQLEDIQDAIVHIQNKINKTADDNDDDKEDGHQDVSTPDQTKKPRGGCSTGKSSEYSGSRLAKKTPAEDVQELKDIFDLEEEDWNDTSISPEFGEEIISYLKKNKCKEFTDLVNMKGVGPKKIETLKKHFMIPK